jgi:hypothetical protein
VLRVTIQHGEMNSADERCGTWAPPSTRSLALEFLGFSGPEVREGLASHLEKRRPEFPPDAPV